MSNPYTPATTAAHPMTRRCKLRRIGVLSSAMMQGVLLAVFGLIIAIVYAIFGSLFIGLGAAGMSGGGTAGGPSGAELAGMGIGFMIVMVIVVPVFYGVIGFISGALVAVVYNLVAGWIGGIEMEFLDRDDARPY